MSFYSLTSKSTPKLKAPPSKLKLHYWAYHGQDPEAKKGADSTVRNLVDIDHYSEEVNSKDSQGNRPLHHAAARNNVQTVNELLEAGAEVDAANDSGDTPLHLACRHGSVEAAKALLYQGKASVTARDVKGYTPLHTVGKSGKVEIAKVLVGNGADLKATGDNNKTPANVARYEGHRQLEQFLARCKNTPTSKDSATGKSAVVGQNGLSPAGNNEKEAETTSGQNEMKTENTSDQDEVQDEDVQEDKESSPEGSEQEEDEQDVYGIQHDDTESLSSVGDRVEEEERSDFDRNSFSNRSVEDAENEIRYLKAQLNQLQNAQAASFPPGGMYPFKAAVETVRELADKYFGGRSSHRLARQPNWWGRYVQKKISIADALTGPDVDVPQNVEFRIIWSILEAFKLAGKTTPEETKTVLTKHTSRLEKK